MKFATWFFDYLLMTVVSMINGKIWDSGAENQYHIQTDEGDERYFKYQTLSGQYRRERRLHDGSVVGSYGWVDADGYLRLNDYIADKAGYRIVQAKKLFVGTQTPSSIVSSTKDLSYRKNPISNSKSFYWPTTSKPEYLRSISKASDVDAISKRNNFKGSISRADFGDENSNFREPNDNSKFLIFPSSSTFAPSTLKKRSPTPPLGYYPATKATPIKIENQSTEPEILITPYPLHRNLEPPIIDTVLAKKNYALKAISDIRAGKNKIKDTFRSESNSVLNDPIERSGTERSSSDFAYNNATYNKVPYYSAREYHTANLRPAKNFGTEYKANLKYASPVPSENYVSGHSLISKSDEKLDYEKPIISKNPNNENYYSSPKQFISDPDNNNFGRIKPNWNGFRYILPRHYHEENSNDSGDEKTGSFGYVDPFGIRRVVYYNASPNGFAHKKSNKYVGFNDTPYE